MSVLRSIIAKQAILVKRKKVPPWEHLLLNLRISGGVGKCVAELDKLFQLL
jgi:hypothetical protein